MAHPTSDLSLVRLEFPTAGCAILTLDRPAAMNALSLDMRKEIVATVDDLRKEADVYVLILTGAGKSFCAGLDLKELGASRDLASALEPAEAADPVAALRRFPGPIIGAINGAAVPGVLLALLMLVLAVAVAGFALLTPSAQALISRRTISEKSWRSANLSARCFTTSPPNSSCAPAAIVTPHSHFHRACRAEPRNCVDTAIPSCYFSTAGNFFRTHTTYGGTANRHHGVRR